MRQDGLAAAPAEQRRAAFALCRACGEQTRQKARQFIDTAHGLAHALLLLRIVPADGELHAGFQQRPAGCDDNVGLRVGLLRRSGLRPLPEHQHRTAHRERRLPDDQLVKLAGQLPVHLPQAVAGRVFAQGVDLGQIVSRPVWCIILAVVRTIRVR